MEFKETDLKGVYIIEMNDIGIVTVQPIQSIGNDDNNQEGKEYQQMGI